jgi:sortase A
LSRTGGADDPPSGEDPPKGGSASRLVLRWIGIVCLVAASGVAGYLTWVLWGTGLETARAQETLKTGFVHQIDTASPASRQAARPVLPGKAVAEILIPAIDVDFIVVQGTGTEALKKGPGHYIDTAMPWDKTGRVGIAGHRTTYLHPFQNLDRLEPRDRIILRTRYGDFTYSVTRVFALPAAVAGKVLDPSTPPDLVLTTCHPEFSSSQRLIVYADRA